MAEINELEADILKLEKEFQQSGSNNFTNGWLTKN